MEAADRSSVVEKLRGQGHFPLNIEEGGARAESILHRDLFGSSRIAQRDIAVATRELATLLKAGLPLDRALRILIDVADGETHSGRLAYATHCLYCHGVEREGDPLGIYPSLENFDDEGYVRDVIRDGLGVMPAFAHLEADEMESLVAYLFGRDDPFPGQVLYLP